MIIPETDKTLAQCHYDSLVWSDNDVSLAMLYNLGQFYQYKEAMRPYFSMEDEQIDYIYWVDNYYCTHMMLDTLRYLYDRQEQFGQMLEYMLQAQPGLYLAAGTGDYPIAHKYGYFEGAVNDAAIVFTPQPYLLACYTQDAAYGEGILGPVGKLFTAYTLYKTEQYETAAQLKAQQEAEEEARLQELARIREEKRLAKEQALKEQAQKEAEAAKPKPVQPEPAPAAPEAQPQGSAFPYLLAGVGAFLLITLAGIPVLRRKFGYRGKYVGKK